MLRDELANVFQRIIKFGSTGPIIVGNSVCAVGAPLHFNAVVAEGHFGVVIFIVMILTLALRPHGLFGRNN